MFGIDLAGTASNLFIGFVETGALMSYLNAGYNTGRVAQKLLLLGTQIIFEVVPFATSAYNFVAKKIPNNGLANRVANQAYNIILPKDVRIEKSLETAAVALMMGVILEWSAEKLRSLRLTHTFNAESPMPRAYHVAANIIGFDIVEGSLGERVESSWQAAKELTGQLVEDMVVFLAPAEEPVSE